MSDEISRLGANKIFKVFILASMPVSVKSLKLVIYWIFDRVVFIIARTMIHKYISWPSPFTREYYAPNCFSAGALPWTFMRSSWRLRLPDQEGGEYSVPAQWICTFVPHPELPVTLTTSYSQMRPSFNIRMLQYECDINNSVLYLSVYCILSLVTIACADL